MTLFARVSRRLRFGSPIVVVSGLPRSGTSMMMQMLDAGGLPLMTDLDAVQDLATGFDLSWLDVTRGQAVEIDSPLLVLLPERYNYRVILMQRDVDTLSPACQTHLRKIHALLAARPCFESLTVDYHDVLADPHRQARRIRRFVRRPLALSRMTSVINERLDRSRSRLTDPDHEPEPAGSLR
jgi:hypothetical protein